MINIGSVKNCFDKSHSRESSIEDSESVKAMASRQVQARNDSDSSSQRLYDRESIAKLKDLKLPASVYTIAAMAGFYFLSEVGINSILTVYLIDLLILDSNVAVSVVLIYRCLTSNLSIVVAFLADNFFSRFSTLVFGSTVYLVSISVFAIMSVPFTSAMNWIIYVALVMRGVGSACCLAALVPFANDQMKMRTFIPPRNVLTFYFFVVWGASFLDLLSVILSTFLKEGLRCFGRDNCYPASYAYCTVNSILGFSVFILGLSKYVFVKPVKAVTAKAPFVIFYALNVKRKSKGRKEKHWLDYAKDKYDPVYVDELKVVIKVIFSQMFLFWTLLHLRYTLWTVQAMRVSRQLGNIRISPEQVLAMYPFFVLIIAPAYFFVGRPLLTRCVKAPLMQMTLAGFLISFSFCCSATVSFVIELDEVSQLNSGSVRVTFVNGRNCSLDITNHFDIDLTIQPRSIRNLVVDREDYQNNTVFFKCDGEEWSSKALETRLKDYDYYYFITPQNEIQKLPNLKTIKDGSSDGTALFCVCDNSTIGKDVLLTIYNSGRRRNIKICLKEFGPSFQVMPGENYSFLFNNSLAVESLPVDFGDVVILLMYKEGESLKLKALRVLNSRRLSFLWMIPQYLLLSISSIIFMLAVFVFQYNETPPSCTALIWSLKHFNTGLDSFVLATSSLLVRQSLVLFLWSLVSFVYSLVFGLLTRTYDYSSSNPSSTTVRVKTKMRTFMYN